MNVAYTDCDLENYLGCADLSNEHPVVISNFIQEAKVIMHGNIYFVEESDILVRILD